MSNVMKQWFEHAPDVFGDFSERSQNFGILRNGNDDYLIGCFDARRRANGLLLHRTSDGGAIIAKYEHGDPVFPIVKLSPDGKATIEIKEEGDVTVSLDVDFLTSSFRYYGFDEGRNDLADGVSFHFDGNTNEMRFKKRKGSSEETIPIEKEFVLTRPMVSFEEIKFPPLENFEGFEYIADEEFSEEFNGAGKPLGIGIASWASGSYAISTYVDGYRNGVQVYQFPNYICIFQGSNQYNGFQIRIYDGLHIPTIEVFYYSEAHSMEDPDYSYVLKTDGESLTFSDVKMDGGFNFVPKGRAIRLASFDKLQIIEWKEGGEKYAVRETISADLLAPEVKNEEAALPPNDPERKLLSLVGQNEAKKECVRLRAYLQRNDAKTVYKNMIFTGGDGVGKTTVGKLMTEILFKYGAIRYNSYHEVDAKTLVNSLTGETSNRLQEVYDTAKGGVLVIEGLHYLNTLNMSNIKEGIHKIASLMQNDPETVFILSDTKFNMKEVLDENYELLTDKIRFRIDFKDFTREELKAILERKLTEKKYIIEEEAMSSLLDVIFLAKTYGNNINASGAIAILEEVIVAQNVRTQGSNDPFIVKDDVSVYINDNDIAFIDQKTGGQSDARKKLDELVGLEKIKDTVDDLIAYFSINRGKRVDFHMVFTGNPGTGKTEVARIIGKLLRQEGILGSSRFLEVTRRDLIGEYIGQTAVKTKALIERAMGGVLYIDEAYSLAYGGERDFGPEAIAELLKAMEDRRGEFCVIMAGYTSEMKKLFDLNPGLKSRVKFDLDFPDYSDEEFEKIARLFLKKDHNVMSEENIKLLVSLVAAERKLPNFANVRTLREYISRCQIKQARRLRVAENEKNNPDELTREDIIAAFGEKEVEALLSNHEEQPIDMLSFKALQEASKEKEDKPFMEQKDVLEEAILAIKKQGERPGESTGFIITKDGYALTCAHCVDQAASIEVRRRIQHRGKQIDIPYKAQVVRIDTKKDVALLKILCDKGEEFDYLTLHEGKPLDPLSDIYMLGYPFGVSRFDALSENKGRVASYQKGVGEGYDQINLDINAKGGNSGSPVLDEKTSRVIGILVGSSISHHGDLVEEINYCRPISYVIDLIENESKGESEHETSL